MNDKFTLEHTHYCKGIAIILMITHHLFWNRPGIGMFIGDMAISQRVGIIGKVCVSLYLMLSGLGLYKSTNKIYSKKEFWCKKLYKLYMNYFFIVWTSILISLIFFREQYLELIGCGAMGTLKVVLSFTGLQYFVGYQGINGAWWFMTVIIAFYIAFPFIKWGVEKYKEKFLVLFFIISFTDMIPLEKIRIFTILSWGFPFVLGVYIAYSNILCDIKNYIYSKNTLLKKIMLLIILLFSLILRQELSPQGIAGIKFDYYLAFICVISIYIFYEKILIGKKIFCFLGKKSMDIYYVHMFITTYYLSELINKINNTFIMIIASILLSLVWSYGLDIIRKIIGWNNFNLRIKSIIFRDYKTE